MIEDAELLILLFFSYSILGWFMEGIVKYIDYKRFINRGFLIGPYCPIYGFGMIFIILLLQNYTNHPLVFFLLVIFICSMVEYTTSYLMEKIFKARWWDYSEEKFNINGRICLTTMIPFGILGTFIMYIVNPFLVKIYSSFSFKLATFLCLFLLIIFLIDNIISLSALLKVRNDGNLHEKDNTEEMSRKVKDIIANFNWKERRLIKAFPNVKFIRSTIKNNINKAKNKLETKRKKAKT